MKDVRAPFDPSGAYVARKDFTFQGKKYPRGTSFPWGTLSCSGRKLKQLYDNGFLIVSAEPEVPPVEETEEAKAERRREAGRKAAETRKRNAAKAEEN